ncbi:unnamed protein product, partial [Prorocentrum cordatum]
TQKGGRCRARTRRGLGPAGPPGGAGPGRPGGSARCGQGYERFLPRSSNDTGAHLKTGLFQKLWEGELCDRVFARLDTDSCVQQNMGEGSASAEDGRVVLRQPRVQLRQARRAQPRRGGRRAPRPQDVPPRGRPLPLREVAAGAAGGRVSLGPRHGAPCEAGLPDHGGQLGEGLRVLHDEQQVPAWGRGLHEVEADSRAGQHGGVELQERPAALRRDQGHPSLGGGPPPPCKEGRAERPGQARGLGQRDEVPLPERLLWQTAARRRSRPAARRGRCPEAQRRPVGPAAPPRVAARRALGARARGGADAQEQDSKKNKKEKGDHQKLIQVQA